MNAYIYGKAYNDDNYPHSYLLSPSNAILTMSTTPPAGFVSRPKRPLPTPLKKPSTPSS